MFDIRDILLEIDTKKRNELNDIMDDYYFFKGVLSEDEKRSNKKGQDWTIADDLDYIPTQLIDNKVEILINKQARFFLGKEPLVLFKPNDIKDKDKCEELRKNIDSILLKNNFWDNTLKAFRLATVTKRVLLRLEANSKKEPKLIYHDVKDFNYEFDLEDSNKLKKVIIAKLIEEKEGVEVWNKYIYTLEYKDNREVCILTTETYLSSDLQNPINKETHNTHLSFIPCWVFRNEHDMYEPNGKSDIKNLKGLQEQYNKRLSDFSDALRFQMFGETAIIDATPETVNESKIAPNSLLGLASLDERTAQVFRVESGFSNAEPARMYLELIENSMYEKLSIPRPEKLNNIPSAKAIKYIYNDLIARCLEKWNDWEPNIISMIKSIIEIYPGLSEGLINNKNELDFFIELHKRFPIPEDEEDRKRLAMEEVINNVRSHRSYLRDFSNDEDFEGEFKNILEDKKALIDTEQDQYQTSINEELSL